jgi:hypothetical protein
MPEGGALVKDNSVTPERRHAAQLLAAAKICLGVSADEI